VQRACDVIQIRADAPRDLPNKEVARCRLSSRFETISSRPMEQATSLSLAHPPDALMWLLLCSHCR
jgi:hypothetical protein